ncbi:hypothetical protein D3Z58_07875 [Clostridiaceae bacterium]|nr:hypothetical protein [Clostridiaceae bacterium]
MERDILLAPTFSVDWFRGILFFSLVILYGGIERTVVRMKELCRERNILYEKQNNLKGEKWKLEKPLGR